MNVRKPADFTPLYQELDRLMGKKLPETALYFAIGQAVCARPEKGAAVMAAEYFHAAYPKRKGFSPRNLRRMRAFARAYRDQPELLEKVLRLGWTQNVVLLEHCEAVQDRVRYLDAALRFGWSKAELLERLQSGLEPAPTLDAPEEICYNEAKQRSERVEGDQDPFRVPRQDRSLTAGTPDMSAFFGNDLCDLHHTYTKKLPFRSTDNKPQVGPVLPV